MLKQSTLLSLMLCLCVLSACGAKNNDWETTKGDQRYQAVTIADHSSAMCLSQDNLYLQRADSGEILQYGGGNLVTAPNSSFTRTDDGKLIVAEPLGSEDLAVHVYGEQKEYACISNRLLAIALLVYYIISNMSCMQNSEFTFFYQYAIKLLALQLMLGKLKKYAVQMYAIE